MSVAGGDDPSREIAAWRASVGWLFQRLAQDIARPAVRHESAAARDLFNPTPRNVLAALVRYQFNAMIGEIGDSAASAVIDTVIPRFTGAGPPGSAEHKAASLYRRAITRTVAHRPIARETRLLAATFETWEELHTRHTGEIATVPGFIEWFLKNGAPEYAGSKSPDAIRGRIYAMFPGGLGRSDRRRRGA